MGRSTFSGPVKSTNGIEVGSDGTQITLIKKGTCTVDLPDIADADVGEATVTITGAAVGDIVVLVPPTAGLTAGLAVCGAQVSAANTVKVRVVNGSGGSINEASGTWYYVLIRS